MPRIASKDSLDAKIAKLEAALIKNREQYEKLTTELEELNNKKNAIKNDEILKAIADSPRSYDEILSYLKGDSVADAGADASVDETTVDATVADSAAE